MNNHGIIHQVNLRIYRQHGLRQVEHVLEYGIEVGVATCKCTWLSGSSGRMLARVERMVEEMEETVIEHQLVQMQDAHVCFCISLHLLGDTL